MTDSSPDLPYAAEPRAYTASEAATSYAEDPDTGGLKLWALLLHVAAIVVGILVGVTSFGWLTH